MFERIKNIPIDFARKFMHMLIIIKASPFTHEKFDITTSIYMYNKRHKLKTDIYIYDKIIFNLAVYTRYGYHNYVIYNYDN